MVAGVCMVTAGHDINHGMTDTSVNGVTNFRAHSCCTAKKGAELVSRSVGDVKFFIT